VNEYALAIIAPPAGGPAEPGGEPGRPVVVDGVATCFCTGQVFPLPPGRHRISLAGPADFAPAAVLVSLRDTSPLRPHEVRFARVG
jgi:hypothetical protein